MHLPTRVATAIGSLALILGGSFSAAQAEPVNSDVVGHLYVDDNTAGVNTVAGFNRHPDGSLTPIAGSPFLRRRGWHRSGHRVSGCPPGLQ
jgi:hypothetical protein